VTRVLRIFPDQFGFFGNLYGSQIQDPINDQIPKRGDNSDASQNHNQLKILTHAPSHSL